MILLKLLILAAVAWDVRERAVMVVRFSHPKEWLAAGIFFDILLPAPMWVGAIYAVGAL